MANQQPFNLIVFPSFTIYTAPLGTAFPNVWDDPATPWMELLNATKDDDDKQVSESGLTVTKSQTVDLFRTYGDTAPKKARRSSQDLMVGFSSPDMTLETLTKVINDVAVTQVATTTVGEAPHRSIELDQQADIYQVAMLVRGDLSAYGDYSGQLKIPCVVQSSSPALAYVKNALTEAEFSFQALRYQNMFLAELEAQDGAIVT